MSDQNAYFNSPPVAGVTGWSVQGLEAVLKLFTSVNPPTNPESNWVWTQAEGANRTLKYFDGTEWQPFLKNSGAFGGFTYNVNTPTFTKIGDFNWNVEVPANFCNFWNNSNFDGGLTNIEVPSKTFTTLTESTNPQYIYVDYNSGTPEYKLTQNRDLINLSNTFILTTFCYYRNRVTSIINWGAMGSGLSNKQEYVEILKQRFEIVDGLILEKHTSPSASNKALELSAGKIAISSKIEEAEAITDFTAERLYQFYYNAGSWEIGYSRLYVDDQNYQGANSRENLGNGKFNINYFWRGFGKKACYSILSTKAFNTLAEAQAEASYEFANPNRPAVIDQTGVYIGCVITQYQQGVENDNIYTYDCPSGGSGGAVITDHNSLSNIQGLDGTDAYHLSSGVYNIVNNLYEDTSRTVTIPTGSTASEIQALIGSIKKNIMSGVTITIQFENGTYDLNGSTIYFKDFLGGGQLPIQGNTSDALDPTMSVNFVNGVLVFENIFCGLDIRGFSINNTSYSGSLSYSLKVDTALNNYRIQDIYTTSKATMTYNICTIKCSHAIVYRCGVANGTNGVAFIGGSIGYVQSCKSTIGSEPDYGLHISTSGIGNISNSNLNGVIADTRIIYPFAI